MLNWFRRRPIEAKDYLRQTKAVEINGISFVIKKILIEDHLSGLNVILNIHQTYTVGKKENERFEDLQQIRKFMRDIIFAGVVKPKLTMAKNPGEIIHVDEILNDVALSQALTAEIINFSYGKKK